MEKPKEFTAINKVTGEIRQYNKGFTPYVMSGTVDEWKHFIDTRYYAKLRLYNYLTFTRKGLKIPRYEPFKGTEIGKSIPILNF